MITLKKDNIVLRALEPSDLDLLKQYLDNSHRDIYDIKQLRLVITIASEERAIGFIDLFDFEPKHRRVGIGIVIFSEDDRGKGYALTTLEMITKYAAANLNVHQVYANITDDNERSIQLFQKGNLKMNCYIS